ncbi:MAG: DNA (cytosine-5-)-methyltransferase [Oscillospiraceae bacterium]|nr:DNA (cytosine-5-)-methyltransferase [Oscillospiraceae bacterium]
MDDTIRFIDLFAGIGGIRQGFELACKKHGYKTTCVLTSEIKPHAIRILQQNHPNEKVSGDITQISSSSIPDFDFLLAGFPCQAFSSAGRRLGFLDTRGTLFFEIERILSEKKPRGFILENVEGLVTHDRVDRKDKVGRTLTTILDRLNGLGYNISWKVLDAKNFGVPQERKRIYIVGTKDSSPNLQSPPLITSSVGEIIEKGLVTSDSDFVKLLLNHYTTDDLYGKAIKDKRGGYDNIHSWDIELKGKVSEEQKTLLNQILKERRKKKWAEQYGIDWMDGMPLTLENIRSFYDHNNLEKLLADLVEKKYLKMEHPKKKVENGRKQDETLPLGYNIVTGKMSFEVNKILDPNKCAPTLVAMDMKHIYVVDGIGIRNLSLREGLRLFGYPESFKFEIEKELGYDLLGNTVVVPVVTFVADSLLKAITRSELLVS